MASGYRLVTYADAGAPKAGVLLGDKIVPAASLLRGIDTSSVLGLLRNWDTVHRSLHDVTANGLPPGDGILLAQAKLFAPILYPGALYCAGANYWDHLEEMAEIAKRVTGKAPAMTLVGRPHLRIRRTTSRPSSDSRSFRTRKRRIPMRRGLSSSS